MHIYIGSVLLGIVIILGILLIMGLPLGELTMGGKYKVWPGKLRIVAVSQLAVQLFALYILLAAGRKIPIFVSENTTKIACIVFALFFAFNTCMNIISPSKKEKMIMTPMSALAAICFALAVTQM